MMIGMSHLNFFNVLPAFIGRLLGPDMVNFHFTCLGTEILLRHAFQLAEFKSEKFPLRRLAVVSQTAILSSQII